MTESVIFRPGRTIPDQSKPRLLLADHLDTTQRVIPDSVDYVTPAGPYGMDGNDQWGDCALADPAHHLQSVTAFGSGAKVEPSEDDVVSAYGQVTGFRKDAGPPGQNPTDRGSNMQNVQSWWRRHGLFGHRTVTFAEVNVRDLDEVCAAIDLFGGIRTWPVSCWPRVRPGTPTCACGTRGASWSTGSTDGTDGPRSGRRFRCPHPACPGGAPGSLPGRGRRHPS